MIKDFDNHFPKIDPSCYISEFALLIGKITIDDLVSVWPGAVLRADADEIMIQSRSNIQDGALLHTNYNMPVWIGQDVTVGHGAILHGCKIMARSLIGMGAIVLDGAVIEEECIIGAGAVVTESSRIPARSMVLGVPGKVVRKVTDDEVKNLLKNVEDYIRISKISKKEKSGKLY